MEYKGAGRLIRSRGSIHQKAMAIRREKSARWAMFENVNRFVRKSWSIEMTTRSRRETVHFKHSFRIKGVDRLLPPGPYEVITDEEMIEGLSFPCFRRVGTLMMVPAQHRVIPQWR